MTKRQRTTHISDIVQTRFEDLGVGGIGSAKRQGATHISDMIKTRFEVLGIGGGVLNGRNRVIKTPSHYSLRRHSPDQL